MRPIAAEIETERLLLRQWLDEDLEPFASLCADPRVMEFLPATLTRSETAQMIARIRRGFERHGFGLWAVELPRSHRSEGRTEMIGFIGLSVPAFEAHFMPCVEIAWRLARGHWGQGYATEGARAVLDLAFDLTGLQEVVAFTVPGNLASRRVMEKLGMTRDPADDFDHPLLPADHPLRPHVLYRFHVDESRHGSRLMAR